MESRNLSSVFLPCQQDFSTALPVVAPLEMTILSGNNLGLFTIFSTNGL